MKIAVSACLAGVKCRYDGNGFPIEEIVENKDNYLLVCPEIIGGLGAPRAPIEIVGNIKTNAYDDLVNGIIKVEDKDGNDYSKEFIDGANKAYQQIKDNNVKEVVVKSKSPTCGYQRIYDGTFSGKMIEGSGIFTSLLLKNGIKVSTEDNFNK